MSTEEALPHVAEEPLVESAPVNPSADNPEIASGDQKKEANPKKTKEKKPSKPRPRSTHPTYLEMIGEAITSLKEKTGSSQYAITKFIEDKHKKHLPANFGKVLLVQLRKFSASGKLTKVKNSYKLPASSKKAVATLPPKAKKPAASKPKPKVSSAASKTKAKVLVKPKPKATLAAKPKKKATQVAKPKVAVKALKPKAAVKAPKPKAALKVSKPKPKSVAAKPNRRPAKSAKTSSKDAPGKKAVVAKKAVAAPKKVLASAKKKVSGKPASKVQVKKTAARKGKM